MKYNSSKKAAVISAVVIAVVALVFCWLYVSRDYDSPWLFFASDYTKKLHGEASPYSLREYRESSAGYLCEEDTVFTADNFPLVIKDCFSAPMRLYYSVDEVVDSDGYGYRIFYKCDDIEANQNFISVFRGITVTPYTGDAYADDVTDPNQKEMMCVAGRIYVFKVFLHQLEDGSTLITFCRGIDDIFGPKYDTFITDTPLLERYEKTIKRVKPFAMELTSPDELPR